MRRFVLQQEIYDSFERQIKVELEREDKDKLERKIKDIVFSCPNLAWFRYSYGGRNMFQAVLEFPFLLFLLFPFQVVLDFLLHAIFDLRYQLPWFPESGVLAWAGQVAIAHSVPIKGPMERFMTSETRG